MPPTVSELLRHLHLHLLVCVSRQCSYIELVATRPQPPKWFVSHWWGEPVADFVACIERHSQDHGYGHWKKDGWFETYDESTAYWVCLDPDPNLCDPRPLYRWCPALSKRPPK